MSIELLSQDMRFLLRCLRTGQMVPVIEVMRDQPSWLCADKKEILANK